MTKKTKQIVPNISFKKELELSTVKIQFDNDEPTSIYKFLDESSKITFELSNTKFAAIEFVDPKSNKKFKIFVDKR